MSRQAIIAVATKDMRAITANVQVWLPMLLVPVLLGVVLPGVMLFAFGKVAPDANSDEMRQLAVWLERLPAGSLSAAVRAWSSPTQQLAYIALNYMFAPLFLMFPVMVSSVIAADSFVGEKERGTLESLLFAPVRVMDLFVGKVLASFIPAMATSLISFVLCAITINAVGWPLMGKLFFPTLNWLPLMLLVVPAVAMLGILFNVLISARVATFQAAYQMGALVILPILLLIIGQVTGLLILDTLVVTAVGAVILALDYLLLRLTVRRLSRNYLFESQVR